MYADFNVLANLHCFFYRWFN